MTGAADAPKSPLIWGHLPTFRPRSRALSPAHRCGVVSSYIVTWRLLRLSELLVAHLIGTGWPYNNPGTRLTRGCFCTLLLIGLILISTCFNFCINLYYLFVFARFVCLSSSFKHFVNLPRRFYCLQLSTFIFLFICIFAFVI